MTTLSSMPPWRVERGASPEWIFTTELPPSQGGGKAVIKVWCMPIDKVHGGFGWRCDKSENAAQANQFLVAQDKVVSECGLMDVTIKVWVAPVNAIEPSTGLHVWWDGLWMERAPGISLNQLSYITRKSFVQNTIQDLLAAKLNRTRVVRAAMLDLLTSQCDRHGQNIFVDEHGQITLIDNLQAMRFGWTKCGSDSVFLPGTQKSEIVAFGGSLVSKSAGAKPKKTINPMARFAADRGQMITIVSAYSPTEAASDEEAGDFYLRVAALADKANDKRDLLIVAGGSQRRAWDSSQLRRPAVRREFNLQLSDRFGLLEAVPPEGADAQAEYDAMAAAIREVATNHLAPRGSRRRRGWQFTLSQRTLRLMDARQRAHTAWLRSKSAAAKRERNRANRAADAAVQRDRERWIGQQVAEAQDMLRNKNLRQFARACDRLAGRSRSHQIPPAMRDVSGALHSGPDGVLKAMTESFDKLYGGETKLSDETLNQLENDVAAFELTRATEVDEAHGRPPDLAETEACVLLDYRCYVDGGRVGTKYPPSLTKCLTKLSGMTPQAIMDEYGFPFIRNAEALHSRATDMLSKSFEWTLQQGLPHNMQGKRYRWHQPCCRLEMAGDGSHVQCAHSWDPKPEFPLGDSVSGNDWTRKYPDPGVFVGGTVFEEGLPDLVQAVAAVSA
ncbi:hypothetical protein FOA52_012763 [Chlamydomonas sp. UWO 241]|nr:hypothetical protein FOA52_012763 [Chlamydomonas sp. UWO 241]